MDDIPIRETRACIDLDRLERNLARIRARSRGAALAPAVKADAYGHGAVAIGTVCEEFGVAMLAVANLEEFIYLRWHGLSAPILILEDLFRDEVERAVVDGAILCAGSVEYAREVSAAAQRTGRTALVHFNIDTGMGRMGLVGADPVAALEAVAALDGIRLDGIFSHFPSSDEADKSFSLSQVDRFQRTVEACAQRGIRVRYRHIANSGAILDFPEPAAMDLVRPGVITYGMRPSHEIASEFDMQPIMRLQSRIVKINRHTERATVGYGRTFVAEPGTVIGIIPVGYGDGYLRALSNRADVLLHGMRVPLAGRVSMDMIAVDLSHVPEPVAVGDEVVLIGEQQWRQGTDDERRDEIRAIELADRAGTISYEITCALSMRVPRIYLRAGRVVATQTMTSGFRWSEARPARAAAPSEPAR